MSMWHEARRTMPDRERFRVWVALKLREANDHSAGRETDESQIGTRWLARADRLIANL